MSRTARRMISVLGALLLLGGCAGELEPSGTPSVSPTAESPEPTQTPSEPTPTPTTTAQAAVVQAPVVNGPNSIDSPSPGSTVTGPTIRVTGEGTAFEATLNYRVTLAGSGEVVEEGWTMAGANGEIGPYTIELTLDPGEYTVEVWEPDASDGESPDGPYRNRVEVTFTVA